MSLKAQTSQRQIAIEDLTGIRQRTKVRKPQRYQHHSWSFYQLRQFVAYKAEGAGIPLVLLDPAYTSRTFRCVINVDIARASHFPVHAATWSWTRIGMPP